MLLSFCLFNSAVHRKHKQCAFGETGEDPRSRKYAFFNPFLSQTFKYDFFSIAYNLSFYIKQ